MMAKKQGKISKQLSLEELEKHAYPKAEGTDNKRVRDAMMICRELERYGRISDWRINFACIRESNLYVGEDFLIEDKLEGTREELIVTIHTRYDDATMGEAQVPLITADKSIMRERLKQAIPICVHTKRHAYDLPEPVKDLTFPESADQALLQKGSPAARNIYERIKAVLEPQDVKTNCFEVLTNASAIRVINSKGVDVSWHNTRCYAEVTMTANHDGEEQEFQWHSQAVSPAQLRLSGLEDHANIARDAVRAQANPGFEGDTILSGRALLDFFVPMEMHNPLVLHAHAKMKIMGISRMELGESIGKFEGDLFTLSSDPRLRHGLLSAPVDENGTPLERIDIIRTGVAASYITTPKYSKQLNVPCTGQMSNVKVSSGATREEHLRGHKYFEIVKFSWFNPDPFSGDFSAEIRLGYLWENGTRIPVRGGTFTGNYFNSLLHARFSKEVTQSGRYYGPRTVLLKDARITGRS